MCNVFIVMKVVGLQHSKFNIDNCENYEELGFKHEIENPTDINAIIIYKKDINNNTKIGYLPKLFNEYLIRIINYIDKIETYNDNGRGSMNTLPIIISIKDNIDNTIYNNLLAYDIYYSDIYNDINDIYFHNNKPYTSTSLVTQTQKEYILHLTKNYNIFKEFYGYNIINNNDGKYNSDNFNNLDNFHLNPEIKKLNNRYGFIYLISNLDEIVNYEGQKFYKGIVGFSFNIDRRFVFYKNGLENGNYTNSG